MKKSASIFEILERRAQNQARDIAYRFKSLKGAEASEISYAELLRRSLEIGAALNRFASPGARVLICLHQDLEFLLAFFGCACSGAIAVPLYPADNTRNRNRLREVALDSAPSIALIAEDDRHESERSLQGLNVKCYTLAQIMLGAEHTSTDPRLCEIALLQYTSGTTAKAKGVVLTQENVLHNMAVIKRAFGHSSESRGVSWLPFYHDMGLMGGIVQPLFAGFPVTLMTPGHFIRRPQSWLECISEQRATTSGGPNAAFELLVRNVAVESLQGLDLSSWRVCFCGSEVVRGTTVAGFINKYREFGLKPRSFIPCYGMAEATLMVTSATPGRTLATLRLSAANLDQAHAIGAGFAFDRDDVLVSSGSVCQGLLLKVVDRHSKREVAEGAVGEIAIGGKSISPGYFSLESGRPRRSEFSRERRIRIAGKMFLLTGDIGFVKAGEVYVLGRTNSILTIRGKKYLADLIEREVESIKGPRFVGRAIAVEQKASNPGDVVVLQEVLARKVEEMEAHRESICRLLLEMFGLRVGRVVFLRIGQLPLTATGKIQRSMALSMLAEGGLKTSLDWRPDEDGATGAGLPLFPPPLRERMEQMLGRPLHANDMRLTLTQAGFDSLAISEILYIAAVPFERGNMISVAELLSMKAGGAAAAPCDASQVGMSEYKATAWHQSLWRAQRSSPGDSLHLGRLYTISGHRVIKELANTVLKVLGRHPALRMIYREEAGVLVACDAGTGAFDFREYDAQGLSIAAWKAKLKRTARMPFDLEAGVTRIRIVRLDGVALLLISLHHIAADAQSVYILEGELLEALNSNADLTQASEDRYLECLRLANDSVLSQGNVSQFNSWSRIPSWTAGSGQVSSSDLGRIRFECDSEDISRLKSICQANAVTLFTGLCAVTALMLHVYRNPQPLSFSVVTSLRPPWAMASVGYFGVIVPVGVRFKSSDSFADVLTGMSASLELVNQARAKGTYVAQDAGQISAGVLLNVLSADRALFPALDEGCLKIGDSVVRAESLVPKIAQCEIVINFELSSKSTVVVVDYKKGLFCSEIVKQMWSAWQHCNHLVCSCPTDRNLPQRCVDLMKWSCAGPIPSAVRKSARIKSLDEFFQEGEAFGPERTAFIQGGVAVSFAQFRERTAVAAGFLAKAGVGAGTIVAVHMERGVDMIVAFRAIWLLGGVVLGLDTLQPRGRTSEILKQSRATILVTTDPVQAPCEGSDCRVLDWRPDQWGAGRYPESCGENADGLAYIVFTSGTTGKPKGIGVKVADFLHRLLELRKLLRITRDDVLMQRLSIAFDASLWELVLPPMLGAKLIFVPYEITLDLKEVSRLVIQYQVTLLHFVPTLLRKAIQFSGPEMVTWKSVRTVAVGGEKFDKKLLEETRKCFNRDLEIWNLYGPAEAAIFVCACRIPKAAKVITVGKPIAGVDIQILDSEGRAVPPGVFGEIYISGGVSDGYINDEEMTGRSFKKSRDGKSLVYRSGDQGRWMSNGEIEVGGRLDDQIKIRGHRIEPSEVEAAILRIPEVQSAVVLAEGEPANGMELSATLILSRDCMASYLRKRIRELLPGAMVPDKLYVVETLPISRTGKVDRFAVPSMSRRLLRDSGSHVECLDETVYLQNIVCRTLGLEPPLRPEERLDDHGLDSLRMIELLNEIRRATGVELSIKDLMENSSIRSLHSLLEAKKGLKTLSGSSIQLEWIGDEGPEIDSQSRAEDKTH